MRWIDLGSGRLLNTGVYQAEGQGDRVVDNHASEQGGPAARESHLADVAVVSLAELFASREDVLAVAVRRVVSEAEQSAQAISGWSSYVDGTGPASMPPAEAHE